MQGFASSPYGGNGFNNPQRDVSVNTKIKTFYSDVSCMQLTWWNENLSIKINPLVSVNSDGIRSYDFQRKITTALVADKALAIYKELKEKFLPEIEKVQKGEQLEKDLTVGITIGDRGNAVLFEYKNDATIGKPSILLTILNNVDPQTNVAPQECRYSYRFNKTTVMTEYNKETGEKKEEEIETEFMLVYDKLKEISELAGNTARHSERIGQAYSNARTRSYTQMPFANANNAGASNAFYGNNMPSTSRQDEVPFMPEPVPSPGTSAFDSSLFPTE